MRIGVSRPLPAVVVFSACSGFAGRGRVRVPLATSSPCRRRLRCCCRRGTCPWVLRCLLAGGILKRCCKLMEIQAQESRSQSSGLTVRHANGEQPLRAQSWGEESWKAMTRQAGGRFRVDGPWLHLA